MLVTGERQTDRQTDRRSRVDNDDRCVLLCVEATMLAYTGSQRTVVSLQRQLHTHTNDISLRFKTPKRTGVLFVASSRALTDYIRAVLRDGLVTFQYLIGGVMPVRSLSTQSRMPQTISIPIVSSRDITHDSTTK